MRFVTVSLVIHAIAIAWLAAGREPAPVPPRPPVVAELAPAEVTQVLLLDEPVQAGGGGGGGAGRNGAARSQPVTRHSEDAWHDVSIRIEGDERDERDDASDGGNRGGSGGGAGGGTGSGAGSGAGIGFGNGGGVRVADAVPAPPLAVEPPPSKARPARLVWPTRDVEVDDEANLFIARVTVDAHGDVIGAHMVTTRPGARADRAANAIWQFRYLPALDDRGVPTRSTFEQPFQIR